MTTIKTCQMISVSDDCAELTAYLNAFRKKWPITSKLLGEHAAQSLALQSHPTAAKSHQSIEHHILPAQKLDSLSEAFEPIWKAKKNNNFSGENI